MRNVLKGLQSLPKRTELKHTGALVLLVFSVILLGGFLFHPSISIDDDWGLLGEEQNIALGLGRLTSAVVEGLFPQLISPLFPYSLLAVSYVLTYTLIIDLHDLRHSWRTSLCFLVFAGFPTNWLIQEFSGMVPGFAIGLVATAGAAWVTKQVGNQRQRRSWKPIPSAQSIILLVVAVGSYQSFATLYLSMGIGYALFRRGSGTAWKQINAYMLPSFLANAAIAVLLYQALYKLVLQLTGAKVFMIDHYFRSPYFSLRTEPVSWILGNLGQIARMYTEPSQFFGGKLYFAPIVIAGGIAMYLWQSGRSERKERESTGMQQNQAEERHRVFLQLLLMGLLLATPLSLNWVSSPNRIPLRAMVGLPYVFWLFAIVWLESNAAMKTRQWIRMAAILSVFALVLQIVKIDSNYYGARSYTSRSDQLVASTIISYLSSRPELQGQSISKLATSGSLDRKSYFDTAWHSAANGSWFNWVGGSSKRIVSYLKTMGIHNLEAAGEERTKQLGPTFARMEAWPSPNSMQVSGDTLLLKLGQRDDE